MKDLRVAFEKLEHAKEEQMRTDKIKSGYKFYGNHTTDVSSSITYSGVVSTDSVRVALTIAS